MENGIFCSEIGLGFGEPGGTPPPIIPRSSPTPARKTNTFAKFESDLLKNIEDNSSEKSQNFTDVCMVGAKFVPPTIQSSVKFRDFVEQYLRSLLTYHLSFAKMSLFSRRSFQ